MYTTERLKKLLSDFIEDRISREDAEELFELINHHDVDGTLQAWLYSKWEGSPMRSRGFHSEGVFEKVRKNLELPPGRTREEKDYVNYILQEKGHSNKRTGLKLLKYAAVFIVAVFSSYFTLDYLGIYEPITPETYTEIYTKYGSRSTITLPDSTVVTLNSGSHLKYPDRFSGKNRLVFLEGEAYFNVKPGHANPFYVETANHLSIKVEGTSFNVKSFSEEQYIETTLVSGKIIIEKMDQNDRLQQRTIVKPNQMAVFDKDTRRLMLLDLTLEEEILEPVNSIRLESKPEIGQNVEILTAWKDEKLIFYNEPMQKLTTKLERWYDVNIFIQDEELLDLHFTGTFADESIEQALEALKLASSFKYKIDKNQIIISK
jgi:ferric-dicitrate binding protein FerR (iron transport regulator)